MYLLIDPQRPQYVVFKPWGECGEGPMHEIVQRSEELDKPKHGVCRAAWNLRPEALNGGQPYSKVRSKGLITYCSVGPSLVSPIFNNTEKPIVSLDDEYRQRWKDLRPSGHRKESLQLEYLGACPG